MSEVEKENTEPNDLVVVGASAGGVEALSVLVSALPMDFPAPLVLAQHLDPNRPSTLDLILQRRTSLPVEVVLSTSPLRAGRIYVVPSNRHVSIKDGHVEVHGDHNKRPRPSVDLLLSTAAQSYGDHLIAVILTGTGSDGAAGAVEVKNAGGTVIVQDPQTARYPSMPLALPPTAVDFEVDVEQIGPLLYDLLKGTIIQQTEERTEDVLHAILEQVSRQASIDFHPYKTSTILRRIGRRMTVTHNHSMRDYLEYIRVHPEEAGELVKAFLINVTQFFRDADAFAYLKREILPKLIAHAREHDRVLRIWTAGCATGEEAYSVAMLLTDILGVELPQWSIKIFATDLDEVAINFARRGLYSENMLKDMPNDYRDRFFDRMDHGFRISKTLRQMVIFGQQDLSHSAPFPRIDLVLCRNVLIYFTPELQDYVLNQFAFSLSPGGYLFLGKAETVRPTQAYYELVNKHWKVYRCTGNALPSMRRLRLPDLAMPRLQEHSMHQPHRSLSKQYTDQEPVPPSLEIGQLRRFNELLLRFLPIGVLVIDRNYHILTANGAARRLLGLRDVGTEQDFLHAVRGIPYTVTRNAIDQMFRERNAVSLSEIELEVTSGGNGRFVNLSMALMQMDASSPDMAAISVTDVTEQVQTRRQLETIQAEQMQLMNELSAANKRLSDVNKELMDANEELQVANEELVLTHEELQASIEEFETTNEELQATNEELETNNEELQATNEELETTNDELRARTNELQELATTLESERIRLAEIVELAPFYILVLHGPTLIVEAYNPRYARLLEGRPVQDRPLEEVFDLFWETDTGIVRLAREVYKQDAIRTTPRMLTYFPRGQGANEPPTSYFVFTLVPSHDANGRVDGVIIYAADETEQRAKEAQEERERLKLIIDNTPSAILSLCDAQTAQVIMMSPKGLEMMKQVYALQPHEVIGRTWFDVALALSHQEAIRLWQTVIESCAPTRIPEVHYLFPDGQRVVWDCTLTPIMDIEQPNKVRFILVTAVEITEQVQAREKLEQLDRLKDDFLSFATHELRTPLTAILGNAQILKNVLRKQSGSLKPEDVQQRDFDQETTMLDSIIHQVKRMNKLIEEMKDAARVHSHTFELAYTEQINLTALLRRLVEQFAHSDHQVILQTSEESITGTLDEARIEQVMNNLINNALKYSPQDKPIVVTVERQTDNPDEVLITVSDEGPGIAEEEQSHIFDRFYRVHKPGSARVEGLGLGLYIAHEIVVQHGGRIWLESKSGKGARFYLSLPLKRT